MHVRLYVHVGPAHARACVCVCARARARVYEGVTHTNNKTQTPLSHETQEGGELCYFPSHVSTPQPVDPEST